jgi:hypothetical protein
LDIYGFNNVQIPGGGAPVTEPIFITIVPLDANST